MAELSLSLAHVATACGVSKALAGQWVKGQAKPNPATLDELALWLGLEPAWLATGKGPKGAVPGLTHADARLVVLRRRVRDLTAETKRARAELRRFEAERAEAQERAFHVKIHVVRTLGPA